MLQQLKTEKSSILNEIEELDKLLTTASGRAKTTMNKKVKELSTKLKDIEDKISEAMNNPESTPEADVDMCVAVNLTNYTKVDPTQGTRFSPNFETPTKHTGWVKSQVEAGLFKLVKK